MASQAAGVSWMETAFEWLQGDLVGASELSLSYGLDHPRLRASQAFTNAGVVLLVFASIGFVISVMSWIDVHVVFKKAESGRTSQIVVAWLMTPMLVEIARDLAADQRFSLLARGGALWRPLIPSLVFLALGVAAWIYTSTYRAGDE